MSLWDNIQKRGVKDVSNPKKWKIFILSKVRVLLSLIDRKLSLYKEVEADKDVIEEDSPQGRPYLTPIEELTIAEQIVYRTILCKPCLDNGSCLGCGCKMPDAITTPENFCSEGLWGEMLFPDDWEIFKDQNQIQFKLR